MPIRAKPPGILRGNFMYRHWKSKLGIMQEGTQPLPRRDQCGMHMPESNILSTYRRTSEIRKQIEDSNGEMWRWKKGVGKWSSVCKGERYISVWRM